MRTPEEIAWGIADEGWYTTDAGKKALANEIARAIRAALPTWQDISTAPKDTSVLTWHPEAGIRTLFLDNEGEWWCSMDTDPKYAVIWKELHPTHWMPLPTPPEIPKD